MIRLMEFSEEKIKLFSNSVNNQEKPVAITSSNDNTFVLYHVGISCDQYKEHIQEHPNSSYNKILRGPLLTVTKIDNPTAEDLLYYIEQVGGKYAWDRRKKYQPENIDNIRKRIIDRKFKIFLFLVDGKEAGFCCTASLNKFKPLNGGGKSNSPIEKVEALHLFADKHGMDYDNSDFIEVYKFGLFDEYTNNGYGHYFLRRIQNILLNDRGYDMIYLDTRDTNHAGVLSFYQRNGFDIFYQEVLPSDLVPLPKQEQKEIAKQQ